MGIFSNVGNLRTNSNSVLFVTSQLRQREIKMAYALRSIGWKVGLIYYNSTPFKPERYFDYVWEVNSAEKAYKCAKKIAPRVVHVFSGAIDDYVLLFCKNKIAPVVIDLNDVFTPSLMNYCPERFSITKQALELADGFCARDLQVKCAEKLDYCRLPPKLVFFPEYCWNKNTPLRKKLSDDEVHIVSVGTVSLETCGMYDCCYLELTKLITGHGIHLHFYPPWSYRKDQHQKSNTNFERDYAQFLELARRNPYLHIHDSQPVDQLAVELPQYDFGIISGGCKEFGQRYSHFKPMYVASCYSGRISDYIDAQLPVLINEEVTFDYQILDRYKIGVDLKGVLQSGFKSKLLALKSDTQMRQNLQQAVNTLSIKANAKRLGEFYSNVTNSYPVQIKQATFLKKLAEIPMYFGREKALE